MFDPGDEEYWDDDYFDDVEDHEDDFDMYDYGDESDDDDWPEDENPYLDD